MLGDKWSLSADNEPEVTTDPFLHRCVVFLGFSQVGELLSNSQCWRCHKDSSCQCVHIYYSPLHNVLEGAENQHCHPSVLKYWHT